MMSEHCVLCNAEIPEGSQVCPECIKKSEEKPPFGVKPYYISIPARIKELAEAIIRCANDTSGICIGWAEEIICHSKTLEEMSRRKKGKI